MPVIEEIQSEQQRQHTNQSTQGESGSSIDVNQLLHLLLNADVQERLKSLNQKEKLSVIVKIINSVGGNVEENSKEVLSLLGFDPTMTLGEQVASEQDQSRDEFSPDSTKEQQDIPPQQTLRQPQITQSNISETEHQLQHQQFSLLLQQHLHKSAGFAGTSLPLHSSELIPQALQVSHRKDYEISRQGFSDPQLKLKQLQTSLPWDRSGSAPRPTLQHDPDDTAHEAEQTAVHPAGKRKRIASPQQPAQGTILQARAASSPMPHESGDFSGHLQGQLAVSQSQPLMVSAQGLQQPVQDFMNQMLAQSSHGHSHAPHSSGQQQVLNQVIMQLTLQQLVQERAAHEEHTSLRDSHSGDQYRLHSLAQQAQQLQQPQGQYLGPTSGQLPHRSSDVAMRHQRQPSSSGAIEKGKAPASRKGALFYGGPCDICGATETSQWRNGPQGKRFCNACGVKFRNLTKSKEPDEALAALQKSRSAIPRQYRAERASLLRNPSAQLPPPLHSSDLPAISQAPFRHLPLQQDDPHAPLAQLPAPHYPIHVLQEYLKGSGQEGGFAEPTSAHAASSLGANVGGSARSGSHNSETPGQSETQAQEQARLLRDYQHAHEQLGDTERSQLILQRLLRSQQKPAQETQANQAEQEWYQGGQRQPHRSLTSSLLDLFLPRRSQGREVTTSKAGDTLTGLARHNLRPDATLSLLDLHTKTPHTSLTSPSSADVAGTAAKLEATAYALPSHDASPFEQHLLQQLVGHSGHSSPLSSQLQAHIAERRVGVEPKKEPVAVGMLGDGAFSMVPRFPEGSVVLSQHELEVLGQAIAAQDQAIGLLQKLVGEVGGREGEWNAPSFKQMVTQYLNTLELSNLVLKECFSKKSHGPSGS